MNRRSILSTLCTGTLALLAPVVAWAQGRRRDTDPMVLAPDGRWYRTSVKHKTEMDLLTKLARGGWEYEHSEALKFRAEANSLRALLAEARDTLSIIRAEVIDTYAESDEWPVRLQPPEWWNHYRRMADATLDRMKGHEHA